jgi:hypothetical protein
MERSLYGTEKKAISTEDRVRMNAEQNARELELGRLKEERSTVAHMYRVKVKELEEKILSVAGALDEGAFDVRFEVVEVPDDARQMIAVQRKDTGAQINVRPMTEVEKEASRRRKQTDMFEDGDDDAPVKLLSNARNGKSKAKKNGKR